MHYGKHYGTGRKLRHNATCEKCGDPMHFFGTAKLPKVCRSCMSNIYTDPSNFEKRPCLNCHGTGLKTSKRRPDLQFFCSTCGGAGEINVVRKEVINNEYIHKSANR